MDSIETNSLFTERQRLVYKKILENKSNKVVASELDIDVNSVQNDLAKIKKLLGSAKSPRDAIREHNSLIEKSMASQLKKDELMQVSRMLEDYMTQRSEEAKLQTVGKVQEYINRVLKDDKNIFSGPQKDNVLRHAKAAVECEQDELRKVIVALTSGAANQEVHTTELLGIAEKMTTSDIIFFKRFIERDIRKNDNKTKRKNKLRTLYALGLVEPKYLSIILFVIMSYFILLATFVHLSTFSPSFNATQNQGLINLFIGAGFISISYFFTIYLVEKYVGVFQWELSGYGEELAEVLKSYEVRTKKT